MRILSLLITAGLILVILGISLGIGAKVATDIGNQMCNRDDATLACSGNGTGTATAGDVAASAAQNSTSAIANLASWH